MQSKAEHGLLNGISHAVMRSGSPHNATAHLPGWSATEFRPGAAACSALSPFLRRTSLDPSVACLFRMSANMACTSKLTRVESSSRIRLTSETMGSSRMALTSHKFLGGADYRHYPALSGSPARAGKSRIHRSSHREISGSPRGAIRPQD